MAESRQAGTSAPPAAALHLYRFSTASPPHPHRIPTARQAPPYLSWLPNLRGIRHREWIAFVTRHRVTGERFKPWLPPSW